METILVLLGVIGSVALFEVLAVRFGVDSRPPSSDDYRLIDGRRTSM